MPLPLIAGLASLAVQAGPTLIRGIAGLFGGSDTATKVADIVETVGQLGLGKTDSEAMIAKRLEQAFTPEQFIELQRLKGKLEEEETRRQQLALADRQSEQAETQATIRAGDVATDDYVRHTRPLLARQSWYGAGLYVLALSGLQAFGHGAGPDVTVLLTLLTPAFAYLGLRTLDGFAPYSKASGDKVAGAAISKIKGGK